MFDGADDGGNRLRASGVLDVGKVCGVWGEVRSCFEKVSEELVAAVEFGERVCELLWDVVWEGRGTAVVPG